jgi:hypothetical protein
MADHWTSVRRRRIETTSAYHSSIFNSTTTCIKSGRQRIEGGKLCLFAFTQSAASRGYACIPPVFRLSYFIVICRFPAIFYIPIYRIRFQVPVKTKIPAHRKEVKKIG